MLHNLALKRIAILNYLIIVEGESDSWALWHADYPAIGIPGSSNVKCLALPHVTGFDRIVIVSEPDVAGAKFPATVADHLRDLGYSGRVETLFMGPSGFKDPSALYVDDPERFRERFDALLKTAQVMGQTDPMQVGSYMIDKKGALIWSKEVKTGNSEIIVNQELANFHARIREEVTHDDGISEQRFYQLEIKGPGPARETIEVSPEDFHSLRWLGKLSGRAIIASGVAVRDRLRHAIQCLSPNIAQRVIYTHSGWREADGEWWYLHGGGAIGAETVRKDIFAELPESLAALSLPDPPEGAELRQALKLANEFVEIGDPRVTYPLFASIWRAAIGEVRFGVFVIGQSAVGKTSLAGSIQSFFGHGFSRHHLPGSWTSTANSLENLTFIAKDSIFVLDDFRPALHKYDRALHEIAERLFRSQANQHGRDRLTSDGRTVKLGKFPRGLLLATGEDYPFGSSLTARMVTVNVAAAEIKRAKLYSYSQCADAGLPASAMAAWIRWLAPRLPEIRRRIARRATELEIQRAANGDHQREVQNLMELIATLEVWQEFSGLRLPDSDAIFESKQAEQREERQAHDEVSSFLEVLKNAMKSGVCHAKNVMGGQPDNALELGWQATAQGAIVSQGSTVMFLDSHANEIFLDIDLAHTIVSTRMATNSNAPTSSVKMLTRLLAENGYVAREDVGEGHRVRKMVNGISHRWVCLKPEKIEIELSEN